MKDNFYFDNAATSWPKPEPVYAFMDSFFRSNGVNPGRSGHMLSLEAEQMVFQTRKMLARFFGFSGDPNRVVFTLNGADAINMAIAGLVKPGDHVITTRLEHNAVLRVANHLEHDGVAQISRVSAEPSGYVLPENIEAAIQPNTKAIVLNHASNVLGTVQDVEAVGAIAKKHGLVLVVDAAQTAGVVPIDMALANIGVLALPGHKGLFGPMGVGVLIVAEDVTLSPTRFGGTGVDSESPLQPETYPHRLESGTVPLPGIAGLHAAQKWFLALGKQCLEKQLADQDHTAEQRLTLAELNESQSEHAVICKLAIEHIHTTEMQHIAEIETLLKRYPSVTVLGAARNDARVAAISFIVDGMSAQQLGDMLDADYHICARAGLHCAPLVHQDAVTIEQGGALRLSPGYFTDEEDMRNLINALTELLA